MTPNAPKRSRARRRGAAEAEDDDYRSLIGAIDAAAADRDRGTTALTHSSFEAFIAGWVGVEVTSFYVTRQAAAGEAGLAFLHEALHIPAPPIFICQSAGPKSLRPYTSRPVDSSTATRIRSIQQNILTSPSKGQQTSAALGARYLQNLGEEAPPHLLLHFAEIIGYSFTYFLIRHERQITPATLGLPNVRQAWRDLCQQHAARSSVTLDQASQELLQVLRTWYVRADAPGGPYFRFFPRGREITAIYRLPADLMAILERRATENTIEAAADFLVAWATALLGSLEGLPTTPSDPMEIFWDLTLINPIVESQLRTRAIYVTIIGSRISSHSVAYAICTLLDSHTLEAPERRDHLDVVLRRLASDNLGRYDLQYIEQALSRASGMQDTLRRLQDAASDPAIGYEQLVLTAARTCHELAGAQGVLITTPDIGLYSSLRLGETPPQVGWFESFSSRARDLLRILAELQSTGWDGYRLVRELSTSPYVTLLGRIAKDLGLADRGSYAYVALPVDTEPMGLLLLLYTTVPPVNTEISKEMDSAQEIFSTGMRLPFRSTLGKGVLSWAIGFIAHPIASASRLAAHRRRRSAQGDDRAPRDSFVSALDFALASVVEIVKTALLSIGMFLVWIAGNLVAAYVHTDHKYAAQEFARADVTYRIDAEKSTAILTGLANVEAAVAAFSICLAATGILFFLRPNLASGQPESMRRFGEPEVLEKSLVRLVAMVLTIDLLKRLLETGDSPQQNALHMILYLCALLGLAFLSFFVLVEVRGGARKRLPGGGRATARRRRGDDGGPRS